MIRLKISNFIRKHKGKIKDLGQKLIMVAVGVFIATIILFSLSNQDQDDSSKSVSNDYRPTETIIEGPDVSQKQYKEDKNLINTFLEFCNNGKIEEAYNLISDECKEELYPTIDIFKDNYYDYIFDTKRECTLQSYISTRNYTVYRIKYLNNMLATGTYNEKNNYQDYITLNRKKDTEKISIGRFIDSEERNIFTKTDEIEATVVKKVTCLSYEEYEIAIKNKMEKTILLNNLEDTDSIELIGDSGVRYNAYINKLFLMDLVIKPNQTRTITIKFMKELSSDNISKEIQILNIIKDYDIYIQNKEEYIDKTSIKIKVED